MNTDTDGRYNAAGASLAEMIQGESDAHNRAAQGLAEDFMRAVRRGDMKAEADFAPVVRDWEMTRKLGVQVMRKQSVGELIYGTLDHPSVDIDEAMRILVAVAYGDEPQTAAARALLLTMAGTFADQAVEII